MIILAIIVVAGLLSLIIYLNYGSNGRKIKSYVLECEKKGYSDEKILIACENAGWKKEQVLKYMKEK